MFLLDAKEMYQNLNDEVNLGNQDFHKAFDGPPTKYTLHTMTIRLFLTWKCFHQERGIQTAQGIHPAFIAEYDAL